MAGDYLTCPFCGFEFAKSDTLCSHGCPMGASCSLARCPNCQYEFPDTPRSVSWIQRLFRSRSAPVARAPDRLDSVRDLRRGERARVLCLGGGGPSRHNNLAVFGVVPGAELTMLQRTPACVVQIGETELALDPSIASQILVERVGG